MAERPVMYLDVDDTLLSMHESFLPTEPRILRSTWRYYGFAPPGVREFVEWALDHFEIRWLTWWCGSHEMAEEQLARLAGEVGVPAEALAPIRSTRFAARSHNDHCLKTDGIEWDEHRAGRPFVWVEDWISDRERAVLRGNGFADCWIPCHVTEDPTALQRVHAELQRRFPTPTPEEPA